MYWQCAEGGERRQKSCKTSDSVHVHVWAVMADMVWQPGTNNRANQCMGIKQTPGHKVTRYM